jgi:excinuclease UvrABC nuclease subunit
MNKNMKWRTAHYGPGLENRIPARSGVYVLARTDRAFGFPTRIEVLYVGRSNNLKRRWREHTSRHELNAGLAGLRSGDTEFWWVTVPDTDTRRLEHELIEALRPGFNQRREMTS